MVDQDAQVRGEISGVGMVVAESAATPGQGVLIHTAGFVVALAVIPAAPAEQLASGLSSRGFLPAHATG